VIHSRQLKDGTYVILNRATTHPQVPNHAQYVRGSILLGAYIIQPVSSPGTDNKNNQNRGGVKSSSSSSSSSYSKVTMITQVDPGGLTPPMIVNQVNKQVYYYYYLVYSIYPLI
jgi:hypothetical protein